MWRICRKFCRQKTCNERLVPSYLNYVIVYGHITLFSGIQKHIFIPMAAFFGAQYFDEYVNQKYANRDAALRHYVQLHPEDFPPMGKFSEDIRNLYVSQKFYLQKGKSSRRFWNHGFQLEHKFQLYYYY